MIKKRFLLPAAAGALALTIGLAGIWFNQQLPALADFGVPGMDSEAQLMAWAALFPEKGVAALTFRTVLQWMAIAVFCTLGAVVLALYRYKPQKELGYFLLYLTVLTLWALVIILAPVGSSGWSVFFRRGFFTVTVLAGILLCAALTGAVPVSHGQRLGSLLLTLGYLVLTLIPPSRVRAVGLLLGMGYCLGILMAMYARGSDAALLMLFPCAITIGFRVWVVLPGMHVPFFQESVFFYLFRCARIYDAAFYSGLGMAYVCRRYALQFDRAEQLARELDARGHSADKGSDGGDRGPEKHDAEHFPRPAQSPVCGQQWTGHTGGCTGGPAGPAARLTAADGLSPPPDGGSVSGCKAGAETGDAQRGPGISGGGHRCGL